MRVIERRIDGAWAGVVTGAAFVLLFLAYGGAYTFGVFFPALSEAFDADRAETALVFSIVGGTYSSLGIISGPAADRFGTRPVCLFGILAAGLGLIFASSATALWQVYLGFGIGVSLGMGCNFAPANAGLQRWVTVRRGLASGIATTGVGLSILVLPYLAALLIDIWDWRGAMLALGLATLALGGLAGLLMGDPPGTPRGRTHGGAGYDLRAALTSRGYVMLYLSSVLCCFGVFVPFVHLVAYATDQGLGEGAGVLLIATIGGASVIGRIFLTWASDRFGRRNSLAVMYLAMGAGLLLWWGGGLIMSPNLAMLIVAMVIFGLGYGGYVAMIAPIIAEYFGISRIGSLLGCFMSSIAIGAFLGPWLAGHAFDIWGSYDLPILGAGLLGLGASLAVMAMPARPGEGARFVRAT